MPTTKTPLYIPFSDVCRTLFINIPDAMREATYRALTRLEREVGDVDAYVAAKLNYCHTQCGEDEFKEGLRTLCSAFANEQVDALALAIRNYEDRGGSGVIIADQAGIGKGRSQPLDSQILTPFGFKKMGEIKMGEKVISQDGTPTDVIGIYPQGKIDVYEILFSDGSKTQCSADHLWVTRNKQQKFYEKIHPNYLWGKYKIFETKELMKLNKIKAQYSIPLVSPIEFNYKKVPIDPYLLGVLLGDACLRKKSIELTCNDDEILQSVQRLMTSGLKTRKIRHQHYQLTKGMGGRSNNLLDCIRYLDLAGKVANSKFIPELYKINSPAVRLAILQGLMDTDGYVNSKGSCMYYTVSSQLASDIDFIVRSFGGTTTRGIKKGKYKNKNKEIIHCQDCHIVYIKMPNGMNPFRLIRKANRVKDYIKYFPQRIIRSIKYIGKKECQCIKVSHPSSLYVTDDFIVTHNTISGMIKYAHLNGMIPVFITKHPTLFTDIYRDLYDIGMDDFVVYKHLIEQTEFAEGDEIADDEDEQVEGIDKEDVPDTDTLYDLKETFKLNSEYDKEARNKKTFVPFIINGKSPKTHIRDFEGNIIYEGLPNTSAEFRNIINATDLPDPYNIILCTYSQFGRLSKKMDYLKSIAHKAFFILDESHTASGESRVGKYLRELTSLAKGTVFSSATFAKRPDNFLLYINKTSLINTNMSQGAIVGAIQKGGVALQEVISSQLTEEGYLIRRERTYDENTQVNYIYLDETQEAVQEKTITHPEWNKKDEHWQKYDNIIQYLFKIIKFQEEYVVPAVEALSEGIINRYEAMGALGAKELKRTAKLGAFTNPLFSQLFNFTYQLFFSLKADIVADIAISHLKAGRKPIIAFKSTLESMLNYLVNDEGEKVKIGDKIRDDYSVILEKLLFSTLRYREEHPDGTTIKFFNPEDIGGDFAIVFKAIHNEIKKMKFGIPSSPIDYILNKIRKAGYTNIEEITARTRKLILSEKEGFVRIAPRKPVPVANIARMFQNNEIDCLLINQSGATGISLHATREKTTLKTDADVKQRAMIIMQAELDINNEDQKRGRNFRPGQIL